MVICILGAFRLKLDINIQPGVITQNRKVIPI